MKKLVLGLLMMVAMIMSASVFANSSNERSSLHGQVPQTTHVAMQGKYCTGTVGCSCSGFSPKKSGDVWEEVYCRKCGHHKQYHK